MSRHRGPVQIRKNAEGGVTVLCPVGHLVEAWRPGQGIWAGSALQARVVSAAHGEWVVECDGALPPEPPVITERNTMPAPTTVDVDLLIRVLYDTVGKHTADEVLTALNQANSSTDTEGDPDDSRERLELSWLTTRRYTADIPVDELVAAGRQVDPEDYLTHCGTEINTRALTGSAVSTFTDLLGRYETDGRVIACEWLTD